MAEFCQTEWPRLVAVLGLVCGDPDRAQDLAQDALVQVCVHWTRVSRADSPTAWLYRVALNMAKSHFRRRGRHDRAMRRLHSEAVTAGAQSVDAADVVAVRDALMLLPRHQREALVLRYYADLPVSEVARLMGCPEGTVKTWTSRAITALRGLDLVDGPPVTEAARDE